jgi:hypothetical protein
MRSRYREKAGRRSVFRCAHSSSTAVTHALHRPFSSRLLAVAVGVAECLQAYCRRLADPTLDARGVGFELDVYAPLNGSTGPE